MYRFTIDADALAALRRRPSSVKSRFRFTTEDGLHLDLPDPRDVAPLLTIDADLRRKGSAILDGTTALPLAELTPALSAAFEALPERPDAGEPYSDIYHAARSASPTYHANYMLSVVRAFRDTLRAPDTVSRERGPAKSKATLQAERRDRIRANEVAVSRAWLVEALANSAPEPGKRLNGARLFAAAQRGLSARAEQARTGEISSFLTDDDDSPYWTVPTRRAFFLAASEILTKRRDRTGVVFVVRNA